jgi:hypothetical protein
VTNPVSPDSPQWQAALEQYRLDRVVEAMDLVREHGIGEAGSHLQSFRLIEAEALTRSRCRQIELAAWLTFEFLPDEVDGREQELGAAILQTCDAIAARLGWDHRQRTHLAILADEANAPWAVHPYGYCTEKEPYEKICLPAYLLDDPLEFRQAVAHEYAHVISAGLSKRNAPRWLEEAVSVLVERPLDEEARAAFVSGEIEWLDPHDLELTVSSDGEEPADSEEEEALADDVWLGYQQAGWIGRYMASLGGERRLGDLLRQHADEGVLLNLRLAFTGRERFDAALRKVYGMTAKELFARTLEWIGEPSQAVQGPSP